MRYNDMRRMQEEEAHRLDAYVTAVVTYASSLCAFLPLSSWAYSVPPLAHSVPKRRVANESEEEKSQEE